MMIEDMIDRVSYQFHQRFIARSECAIYHESGFMNHILISS